MKKGWDQDMPSEQELWHLQVSCEQHPDIRVGDCGEYKPIKVGKEYRITVDGDYVYYKRLKDAKAAITGFDKH